MKEEWNLSDKLVAFWQNSGEDGEEYYSKEFGYLKEDVKEFIKRLKEYIQKHIDEEPPQCFLGEDTLEFIDKLAGEKLK